MMALAMLLPSVFPKWFTPAGDAVLADGTLEFFAVGTTTPKSVYADYQQLSAIGNVVTLDGAGDATIFLGSGGYKVILKDSLGAQLDLVDGIFGTGGSAAVDSNATYGFFKVYNDLRAISTAIDVAYVAGRDEEGDGGEGWFQLQPGVVAHDDDGIFLAAVGGSIEYKRIFDSAISPEWYGVRYAVSVDQSVALLQALSASAAVNFPVLVTDRIFLAQNVAAPVGASLVTGQDAYFQANASVSLTFQAGTRFDGRGVAFSGTVQPIFAAETVDAVRLSWFGGSTPDDAFAKFASAGTAETQSLLVDVSLSLNSATTQAKQPVTFGGGSKLTIAAGGALTIPMLVYRGTNQIFAGYDDPQTIGFVTIGPDVVYPEWFGAVGDGATDDSGPVYAAARTGRLDLTSATPYFLGPTWISASTPSPLRIIGGTLQLDTEKNLGTSGGVLSLEQTKVANVSGNWFAGASLHILDSEYPATFTATAKSIIGGRITGDSLYPRFGGFPRIDNAHLDLISAHLLKTDANGKVIDSGHDLTLDSLTVAKLVLSSLASTPTLKIFTDSTVLVNPMPMFLAVISASYSTSDIYLPIPVKANNDPNIIFVFRRGIWDGQKYHLKSQYGNFYKTGTPTSEVFKDYIIAYYDYDGHGWVTFGSN